MNWPSAGKTLDRRSLSRAFYGLECRIQDQRAINSEGTRGRLSREWIGSDRFGEAYALEDSARGFVALEALALGPATEVLGVCRTHIVSVSNHNSKQ